MAATGRGASLGVLVKSAEALQRAADVGTVLLDKTATLTEGKPSVVHFEAYGDEARARSVAFALESKLNHPLAQCIVAYCGDGAAAEDVEYVVGQGARGMVDGKEYFLGNDRMMAARGVDISAQRERFAQLSAEGKTVLFLADGQSVLALFALADTLKEGSAAAVASLREMGLTRTCSRATTPPAHAPWRRARASPQTWYMRKCSRRISSRMSSSARKATRHREACEKGCRHDRGRHQRFPRPEGSGRRRCNGQRHGRPPSRARTSC